MEQTTERKAQARRRRNRERRRWKLIRYLLAAAAILLAVNVFFEISDIQVAGNVIYSAGEVLEASGIHAGRSALTVSDWLTERRIRSALPGISAAGVSLSLPDTLIITVEETPVLAVLETAQGPVPISGSCEVTSGFRGDEAELVHIFGLEPEAAEVGRVIAVREGDSTKLSYLQALLPLLEAEEMLGDVRDVDVSNVSNLHFRYLDRFTVRLGEQEELAVKLDRLRRLVRELNAGDSGILDLSTKDEGHYIPG